MAYKGGRQGGAAAGGLWGTLLQPTTLLLAVAGLLIGFMLFSSVHQRERIQSALRRHHETGQVATVGGEQHQQERQTQQQQTQHQEAQAEVDPCEGDAILDNTELWGDVVKAGHDAGTGKGLQAASAVDCCRKCEKQRGCNRWVFCRNEATCGKACWLKRSGNPNDNKVQKGGSILWTSGFVPKDFDIDPASLPPVNTSISRLVVKTPYGPIRILLKPDWSAGSVTYVRRLAATPELCGPQCQFYRAEPGFLLQGSLRGFIPPNNELREGPKFMERGEIGWAGGSSGPDWFIYLGEKPATHFGRTHTVWGIVDTNESLAVVEKIVQLPATAPQPGGMHMLNTLVDFTVGTE